MSPMFRRFVHLIADDVKGGYTLRNIDVKPLFAGVGARSTKVRWTALPRPAAFFECGDPYNYTNFFSMGSKIVSVNMNRHTILYDTITSAMSAGPDLHHGKFLDPAWAVVRGKLYVGNAFDKNVGTVPCFEALCLGDQRQDWCWDMLPIPPFLVDPSSGGNLITCFASGDDNHIWISTLDKGTYIFNTTTATWCKVGDWALPFRGQVQYIPEYGLSVGFSRRLSKLCSADLIVGSRNLEPPVHNNVWDDVGGYSCAHWKLARSYLAHLGCNKFCVARFYDTMPDLERFIPFSDALVLTALEARIGSRMGDLQMTEFASRCYKFDSNTLYGWVL